MASTKSPLQSIEAILASARVKKSLTGWILGAFIIYFSGVYTKSWLHYYQAPMSWVQGGAIEQAIGENHALWRDLEIYLGVPSRDQIKARDFEKALAYIGAKSEPFDGIRRER